MNLHINRNCWIWFCLVIFMSVPGVSREASALVQEMSIEELTTGADEIVVGQVLHRKSHWNRDKTDIYTKVVISTQEQLKGNIRSGRHVIWIPGGSVGDTTVEVTDVPDFSVGETVLIFVRQLTGQLAAEAGLDDSVDVGPWFLIHGGFQGKFSIRDNNVGNLPLIQFKERIRSTLTHGFPAASDDRQLLNSESVASIQTISAISPTSAPAGTNALITLSGSNLGEETGTPYFFYKNNEYYGCTSCVDSWSDTGVVVKVPVFTASNGYSAAAGSGPVYLMTPSGAKSNAFPFSVTFAYGGIKWQGLSPVVAFKVNSKDDDAVLKAVQDAANTWNAASGNRFSFEYAGATSVNNTSINQVNEIIWANLPNGIIGQATMRSSGGIIRECDIKFNTQYQWSADPSTPENAMDVHTVALHEMGHWLNLRDLYGNVTGYPKDTDKIMYGYGGNGTQKRNLTLYDSLGIRHIYPGDNPCAAFLSESDASFHLFVPVLDTTPKLWIDLQYDPSASTSMMFRLTDSGQTTYPEAAITCQPASLSLIGSNYVLQIPELRFNGSSYRVELTYVPTTDGWVWLMLSRVWTNS